MTLLISLADENHAILVSDRRLTYPPPLLPDDETNKVAWATLPRARFAVGFTGLGNIGSAPTVRWFLESFLSAARPDYRVPATLERLRDLATAVVRPLPYSPVSKRLTIAAVGYVYGDEDRRTVAWRVTNFDGSDGSEAPEAAEEFQCHLHVGRPGTPVPYAALDGAWSQIGTEAATAFDQLRGLQADRRPVKALVGKAVEVIQLAAAKSQKIGAQVTSMVLEGSSGQMTAEYHPSKATSTIFGPSLVRAEPGFEIAFDQPSATSDGTILAGPKLGRNSRCFCGSGLKYKWCHGRSPAKELFRLGG